MKAACAIILILDLLLFGAAGFRVLTLPRTDGAAAKARPAASKPVAPPPGATVPKAAEKSDAKGPPPKKS